MISIYILPYHVTACLKNVWYTSVLFCQPFSYLNSNFFNLNFNLILISIFMFILIFLNKKILIVVFNEMAFIFSKT